MNCAEWRLPKTRMAQGHSANNPRKAHWQGANKRSARRGLGPLRRMRRANPTETWLEWALILE